MTTLQMKQPEVKAEPTLQISEESVPEYDLSSKVLNVPRFEWRSVKERDGTSAPADPGVNGKFTLNFRIPAWTAVNLARSRIMGKRVIVAQGGGNFIWAPAWGDISQVRFYGEDSGSNFEPVNMMDVSRWVNFSNPWFKPKEDVKNADPDDLFREKRLGIANPFFVHAANTASIHTGTLPLRHLPLPSAANAALTSHLRYQLADIRGTLFELDQNLMFSEAMMLEVTFDMAHMGWLGTSAVDPSIGPAALALNNGALVTYTEMELQLCFDTNKDNEASLKASLASGLDIAYPTVHTRTFFPNASTQQEFSMKLTSTQGAFLRRLCMVPYFATTTFNNWYNHAILTNHDSLRECGVAIDKIRTYLDGKALQRDVVYNTPRGSGVSANPIGGQGVNPEHINTSYKWHEDLIKNAPGIHNLLQYLVIYAHIDDWTRASTEKAPVGGLDLTIPREWSMVVGASNAFNQVNQAPAVTQRKYYTCHAMLTRIMHLGPTFDSNKH